MKNFTMVANWVGTHEDGIMMANECIEFGTQHCFLCRAEYDGAAKEVVVRASGSKRYIKALCHMIDTVYGRDFEISPRPCAAVTGKHSVKLYTPSEHFFLGYASHKMPRVEAEQNDAYKRILSGCGYERVLSGCESV